MADEPYVRREIISGKKTETYSIVHAPPSIKKGSLSLFSLFFTAKIELELASVLTGRRDVERRQDNLDRVRI